MKNYYQLQSKKKIYAIFLGLTFYHLSIFGQTTTNDSIKLDYNKINAYCVQTNINPVLDLLDVDTTKLSEKDIIFKNKFENRFKYLKDRELSENQNLDSISSLIAIFKSYWRASLLNPDQDYDSVLTANLNSFFSKNHAYKNDTIELELSIQNLVANRGYYTLAMGRVGKLKDLLIWRTQIDTIYTFSIHNETINTKVVFLEDFITKGWIEYATIYKSMGGWAGDDGLYCLKESYDIESDWFRISYLAHEGRHFTDYKLFPNLSGYDLEYRAKLTELSLAQETLFSLIKQFISIANYDSDNQHPFANYYVIKEMSKKIFDKDFVNDLALWESIDTETINKAAYSLFKENTVALQKEGTDVEHFIRNLPR